MGVIKGIIHLFSLAAAFYKPCGFKYRKLVGNGALAHSENFADAADAHFAFRKGGKNSYSCFIAENLENLCGFFKDLFRRHVRFRLFYDMGMFGVNICQKELSFFVRYEHMNNYSYVLHPEYIPLLLMCQYIYSVLVKNIVFKSHRIGNGFFAVKVFLF